MSDIKQMESLLSTQIPLVVIESHEEQKVINLLERVASLNRQGFYVWNLSHGLRRWNGGDQPYNTQELVEALRHIEKSPQNGVFLFLDAHPFMDNPLVIRTIKNIAQKYELVPRMQVFLSARISLPEELSRMAVSFKPKLPDRNAIRALVQEEIGKYLGASGTKVTGQREALEMLIQHVGGLSEEDARRLIRVAIRDDGKITLSDIGKVLKTKHEFLRSSEILNLETGIANLEELGGLKNLKRWLAVRREIFLSGDPSVPLPAPKGVLLLGVQGAGKSLAAKTVAGAWYLPLFRLDFGTLYDKFHGETERNLREALSIAGAMSPCVLWMDEIEKGISGDADGTSDGGVSQRVLGTLLTWMAERRGRVFLVATANDIQRLPPELLRKGRFDEIFFIDLPQDEARRQILRIHLQRRKLDPAGFDLERLSAASKGFSGAEIEQAIVSALYEALAAKQALGNEHVLAEIGRTRPLSVIMAEKVQALREWALQRAVLAD